VSNDDGTRFWSRFGADVGGLRLFDNHGTWDYLAGGQSLVLWYAKRNPDGSNSGIALQNVPSNFFRSVVCGQSVSGEGGESGLDQLLLYTLWFGCVWPRSEVPSHGKGPSVSDGSRFFCSMTAALGGQLMRTDQSVVVGVAYAVNACYSQFVLCG